MDIENELMHAIQDGMRKGIQEFLSRDYKSPLTPIIEAVLLKHSEHFKGLLGTAITAAVNDQAFRDQIVTGIRHKLASVLIQRFGGEMEKQVNVLKSDPVTRARITLALEEIVKDRTAEAR